MSPRHDDPLGSGTQMCLDEFVHATGVIGVLLKCEDATSRSMLQDPCAANTASRGWSLRSPYPSLRMENKGPQQLVAAWKTIVQHVSSAVSVVFMLVV